MDDLGITTMDEAFDNILNPLDKVDESDWGPWKLNRQSKSIYVESPYTYSLPLSDLKRAALFATLRDLQVKTWANNDCLGGLVRAAFSIYESSSDPVLE